VATGVSVNIGVFGMVLSAVDLGYQVVLPRDGVAGVPADYAETVIDQALSLLSTVVTSEDLLAVWETGSR
jgi:nicotinamidase-related amidase